MRNYASDGDESVSEPIKLVGNKRYYIELIVGEGGGGDNMAVAWKMPGGNAPDIEVPQFQASILSLGTTK